MSILKHYLWTYNCGSESGWTKIWHMDPVCTPSYRKENNLDTISSLHFCLYKAMFLFFFYFLKIIDNWNFYSVHKSFVTSIRFNNLANGWSYRDRRVERQRRRPETFFTHLATLPLSDIVPLYTNSQWPSEGIFLIFKKVIFPYCSDLHP